MGWAERTNPKAQDKRRGLLTPKEKKLTPLQRLKQERLRKNLERMNGGRDEGNRNS